MSRCRGRPLALAGSRYAAGSDLGGLSRRLLRRRRPVLVELGRGSRRGGGSTVGFVDRSILWRAALVQTLAVGVLFAVLALTLPHSFFEDWGAIIGPAGWIAASLVTMKLVGLSLQRVALASAAAGALAALVGAVAEHAVSLPVAVLVFALICAARPAGRPAGA